MPADDRDKWNAKYSDPEFAPRNPSRVLQELAEWLPAQGRALDVAGGAGRHAIWLASRGQDVTIADVSAVGLQVAERRAAEAGVRITTLVRDLAEQGLPAGPWDLVLSVCYLWQPTPELCDQFLAPGGTLIMIQPTTRNLERHDKPPRDFLLEPGEVAARFTPEACQARGLQICHFQENWSADDRHDAVLVVRKVSSA
jgi:2-polyprenyl-3-methyl-5-hydroxy-6-metoxy-1,4-benzoquinol methylase